MLYDRVLLSLTARALPAVGGISVCSGGTPIPPLPAIQRSLPADCDAAEAAREMLIVATDSQLLRTRKKEWKKRKGGRPQDDDEDHQPPRCVLALFYRTDGRGQVLYTTPSIKYDGPVKIRVHLLACLFYFRFSIFVYIYLWWDRDDEADRQAVVEGNVSGGMQHDGSGGRSVGILVFNTPTDSAACQIRRFWHIKKKKRRWWFIFFFFFA